jgi:hypothetical protein
MSACELGFRRRSSRRRFFHGVTQRRHAKPVDVGGRLSRIIHRNHGVVIAAMAFGEVAGGSVGRERPDMPRTDAKDVCHAPDRSADLADQSRSKSAVSCDSVATATVCQEAIDHAGLLPGG